LNKILKNIALVPLSWLYGAVTNARNLLYDNGLLRSRGFDIPIILIGNLAAGGTGKTPHVEMILSVLQDKFKTAVLSRGYKRKSRGFVLAEPTSNSNQLGDEPMQIYRKFPNSTLAVCEDRVLGVTKLLKRNSGIEVIVMDDGFQHRKLKPGLTVLLTDYNRLYTTDRMLPAGRLRESSFNSLRADIIIVTKCPEDIKPIDMRVIETDLNPKAFQSLYFSQIVYRELKPVFDGMQGSAITLADVRNLQFEVLVVAGIVSPQPMCDYLGRYSDRIQNLIFPDHHSFTKQDIKNIEITFEKIQAQNKVIICTEKDAVRFVGNQHISEKLKSVMCFLPIGVEIIDKEKTFIQKISHYVTENSRNSRLSEVQNKY
jgi:tetraacyldisaccharide 4'-kinase